MNLFPLRENRKQGYNLRGLVKTSREVSSLWNLSGKKRHSPSASRP